MTETSSSNAGSDLDAAAQRVRELSEKVATQARENGLTFLEGYERMLKNMLDFEEKAARGTGQDWAANLATTHANFVRETSEVVLNAWRDQLKQ